MVPREGSKREHGAAYPSGAKTVAAPATVGAEPEAHHEPLGNWEGGAGEALTREPGDLPSLIVTLLGTGWVSGAALRSGDVVCNGLLWRRRAADP